MANRVKKPKADNPEQSQRFIEGARAMEASGELNLTEGAKRFEEGFAKMAKKKPDEPSGSA